MTDDNVIIPFHYFRYDTNYWTWDYSNTTNTLQR